jgi:hypothetical protein
MTSEPVRGVVVDASWRRHHVLRDGLTLSWDAADGYCPHDLEMASGTPPECRTDRVAASRTSVSVSVKASMPES